MRTLCFVACLTLFAGADAPPEAGKYVAMFDGKTLNGWEGNEKMFRVRDGAIVGGTLAAPIDPKEFLCTTRDYENFELRVKSKLVGEGQNGGIQVRSRRVPGKTSVSGYQCDTGQHKNNIVWGALYDESRRNKFLVLGDQERLKSIVRRDGWNDIVICCQGPRIQIWINGFQTVDYTERDDKISRKGLIAVQIHDGGPSEAWYKDIKIKEL